MLLLLSRFTPLEVKVNLESETQILVKKSIAGKCFLFVPFKHVLCMDCTYTCTHAIIIVHVHVIRLISVPVHFLII